MRRSRGRGVGTLDASLHRMFQMLRYRLCLYFCGTDPSGSVSH